MRLSNRNWQLPNPLTLVLVLCLSVSAFLAARGSKGRAVGDPTVSFREVSSSAGISFVHTKPVFDDRVSNIGPWLSAVGASASAADYEASGLVSVFFTNSGHETENALYRNERIVGGMPQFRDVTAEVGLAGMNRDSACFAAAWGDYDNDGYPDLFVVRAGGGNLLFHNVPWLNADGSPVLDGRGLARRRFVDVTQSSGLGHVGYGVGALWFDYDRDGKLDLLVADYFPSKYRRQNQDGPDLDLWHVQDTRFMPESFNNAANGGGVLLYHNDGGGHFTEMAKSLGMTHAGWALALGAADINNDGWPDVYVANDFGPDDLYVNVETPSGQRRFTRIVGGFTADKLGRDTKKGMGVDFADVNHAGFLDIYVTNITQPLILPEGNMLWMNRPDASRIGGRNFENMAEPYRVNDCGWSWGAKFADVDNDGWVDLFVVNGMISASRTRDYWYELQDMASNYRTILADASNWPVMADKSLSGYEHSCLFVRRNGHFVDIARAAGISDEEDGRGIAVADFNNDGAIDFLIANQGQGALLYLNQLYEECRGSKCPNWIGFRLEGNGQTSNTDAIGSRVEIETEKGPQMSEVSRGNGFASQNDPRVRFGLGTSTHVSSVRIIWTDGRVQAVSDAVVGTYNYIHEPN